MNMLQAGQLKNANVNNSNAVQQQSSPWPDSLEAIIAAPKYHRILLENERVRVLDVCIPQDHTVPVHTHRWPAVLVVISAGDFVRRDANGDVLFDTRTAEASASPLSPTWSEPFPPHSVENVGDSEIRVISIELKD